MLSLNKKIFVTRHSLENKRSKRKTFQQLDENSRHCMKFSSKEGKSSNIERQFFPNKGKVIEKFMSIIKSNGKQEINFDVQKSPC